MANRKKSSKDAKPKVDKTQADEQAEEIVDKADGGTADGPDNVDILVQDATPEDAEVIEDQPIEGTAEEVSDDAPEETDTGSDAEGTVSEEAESVEATDGDVMAEEGSSIDAVSEETRTEEPPLPAPTPVSDPHSTQQSAFFPMLLGGVVAAAIGFGVARFVLPDGGPDAGLVTDIQRKIDGQAGAVSKLTERLDAVESDSNSGGDTGALEAAQVELQAALSGMSDRMSGIEKQLSDLESQIAALAARPADDGTPAVDLTPYQNELKELQSTVDAMAENAALMEKNAQSAAQATLQRAALTRIFTALDAGAGFEPAVADLESLGVSVPAALAAAASGGIVSLSDLQESFPDAARAALDASRDAGAEEAEGSGLTSFLRSRLGARSLEPREGSDPDAVLSRIEAAIREGRLSDALAEVEALPEAGRMELSEWSSHVTQRLEAVAAAQELGDTLN